MPELPRFKVFDSINIIITMVGLFLGVFPFIFQLEQVGFLVKLILLMASLFIAAIIALLRSMYDFNKELIAYSKKINQYYDSTSDIVHKHQALAKQFRLKSSKLDNAEQHFTLMSQVLANHISLTEPYSKKKENDRYLLLHQLNSEALTKLKENEQ